MRIMTLMERSGAVIGGMCLLLAVHSWCQGAERVERGIASATGPSEWMRGVPAGFRLVAFDVRDGESRQLRRQDRVYVSWEYAAATDRLETMVLIDDLSVLATERLVDDGLRVTFALTPSQAERLRVAAACGAMEIRGTSGGSMLEGEALPVWEVCEIEDRTEAIELHLAASSEASSRLERPTLATRGETAVRRARGVITLPVRIELRR